MAGAGDPREPDRLGPHEPGPVAEPVDGPWISITAPPCGRAPPAVGVDVDEVPAGRAERDQLDVEQAADPLPGQQLRVDQPLQPESVDEPDQDVGQHVGRLLHGRGQPPPCDSAHQRQHPVPPRVVVAVLQRAAAPAG